MHHEPFRVNYNIHHDSERSHRGHIFHDYAIPELYNYDHDSSTILCYDNNERNDNNAGMWLEAFVMFRKATEKP